MNYQLILEMAILYGIAIYFHRHQGSHLAYIKIGEVTLNPILVFILWVYNITFLPWLALIFIGYKNNWKLPLIILLCAQIISMVLVSLEIKLNLQKNAALISLFGIFVIPISLILLIVLSNNIAIVNL